MHRHPISGSSIRFVGHEADVLEVTLTGGTVMRYVGVPASVMLDILDSKTPMATFNRLVRGKYRGEHEGEESPPGPAPRGSRPRGPAPKPKRDPNPGYDPHGTKRGRGRPPGPASPRAIKVVP